MYYPFSDSTHITCDSIVWTCDWDYPFSELVSAVSRFTIVLNFASALTVTENEVSEITETEDGTSPLLQ